MMIMYGVSLTGLLMRTSCVTAMLQNLGPHMEQKCAA
jgi:hypothetical protein